MRRGNKYQITVMPLGGDAPDTTESTASLVFMHENHDDLLLIVQRMRKSTGLDSESAAATAIGLKLLAEVMLKQRDNPLFDVMRTPMRQFIHALKSVGERTDR
jgi:hypothetical protein